MKNNSNSDYPSPGPLIWIIFFLLVIFYGNGCTAKNNIVAIYTPIDIFYVDYERLEIYSEIYPDTVYRASNLEDLNDQIGTLTADATSIGMIIPKDYHIKGKIWKDDTFYIVKDRECIDFSRNITIPICCDTVGIIFYTDSGQIAYKLY